MNYETIVSFENFIEKLDNPRKQQIARNIILDSKFEIFEQEHFNTKQLFITEKSTNNVWLLSTFISSKCNC
jgi:hypothetical protein